jgi:hypothetical protein
MRIEDTPSEEIIAISCFVKTLLSLKNHTEAITEYALINETRKKLPRLTAS